MHYEAFCGSNINFKDTINVCKLIYSRTMIELKTMRKKTSNKNAKKRAKIQPFGLCYLWYVIWSLTISKFKILAVVLVNSLLLVYGFFHDAVIFVFFYKISQAYQPVPRQAH